MAKYKQTNIEVDARQYTTESGKQLAHWVNTAGGTATWMEETKGSGLVLPEQLYVITDEGESTVNLFSWIVLVDGIFEVYSDRMFKKRFEKA